MTSTPRGPKHNSPEAKPLPWPSIWRDPEENKDWIRDLVEHSQDLLCVHDLQGRFLSVNPVPARLLGYTVEEILQIPMRDLIDPNFRHQFDAYLREIESAGEARGVLAVLTRTGERRLWEYRNTLRTDGVKTPVVRGIAHDVTDRVHAERALREANKKLVQNAIEQEETVRKLKLFRAQLDESNDGIEVVDPETLRLLDVNETECARLGYSRDELLSMTIFDLDPNANKDSLAQVREKLRKNGFVIMESVHRRKDGTLFPVELNIKLVHLDKEYVVAVTRDVSERQRAAAASRSHLHLLESLERIEVATLRETDVEKMLRNVVKITFEIFDCDRAWLFYPCDPEAPSFRVPVEITRPEFPGAHALNADVPIDETAAHDLRAVLASDDPLSYTNGTEAPVNDLTAEGFGVQAQLVMAIHPKVGNPWVFGMHQCSHRRIWTPEEQTLFREIGRRIADHLSNVLLLREVEESERRFRALHDRAPVGIALVDSHSGRFLQVNPRFCEIAGRSTEEMLRLGFRDITHPEGLADGNEQLRQLVEENTSLYDIEKRYVRPDGTPVWVSLSVVPMWKPGEQARWHMAIAQDITQRREAEQALRESEERLRLAEEAAKVGSFERNLQTGEGIWSPLTEAMFGLEPGAGPKSLEAFLELVHPEDRPQVKHRIAESMETGTAGGEWRVVWPDGSVHWISGRWRVFKNADGNPARVIGMDFDITERKQLEEDLRRAKERLTEEKLYLEQEIDTELGFEDIIGRSKALRAVMESAGKVATSDATVLLLGETGTGKELIARAIHRLSQRAENAFIKMNCAAIPSGLLESELFGNEKGAFTGAVSKKIGRLELADKGTLFLDEVGEIPLALQPKLLRVLQDQEFERLGGTHTLKVNFRLIAATNRDLGECVRENEFRSDLYYRLNVFPILLPPLRDRREDIPLLVEHFVQKCARRMNKLITSVPNRTMGALAAWNWPGNVRELENFVERSVILTNGSVLAAPLTELRPGAADMDTDRDETLKSKEREHILRALRDSHGQISGPRGAAVRLGLKRTTLQSKLKNLGIHPRIPPQGSP